MNIPESRRKIVSKVLRMLCVVLGLASAFVLGVLYDRHTEVSNFLEPKPRAKAVVNISAEGVSAAQSQDFTLYAKGGAKVEGEKVLVSGFGEPISIFNEALEVELHFDTNFQAQPKAEAPSESSTGSVTPSSPSSSGKIVASKNGTKYYFEDCKEVARIKSENIVSFGSEEGAKAAGYGPSSCVLKSE